MPGQANRPDPPVPPPPPAFTPTPPAPPAPPRPPSVAAGHAAEWSPMLIPPPRSCERLGGVVDVGVPAGAPLRVQELALIGGALDDRSILGQAYQLLILADGSGPHATPRIEIRAASPAGFRHARATLAQLRRQYGSRLPALQIRDQPALAVRGVMLDISRDRVPTMAHLFETVDRLAELKYNHLQLYVEHAFAYPGHEEVWAGVSALTPEEVYRLDDHCAARGIELAANQNCFGHLKAWLEKPRYRDLAETHGDWVFDVWPRSGPFSLCPIDPRSLALVGEWLGVIRATFRGGRVNIGCDETYDVGAGRSAEEVERLGGGNAAGGGAEAGRAQGRARVYARFVAQVARRAMSLGLQPMFWADIALSHPQVLAMLPPELLALAWGYEPDAPFERWGEALRAAGLAFWVCPGTSAWITYAGRPRERTGNLHAAAVQGMARGAGGMLVCDWGDRGHRQQWPVTAHALAHGAHAAWTGRGEGFDPRASSLHVLGDPSLTAGAWLDELGDADAALRDVALPLSRPGVPGRLRNAGAAFMDLHTPLPQGLEVGSVEQWSAVEVAAASALARRSPQWPALLADELTHAAEATGLAASRGARRRAPGGLTRRDRAELAEQFARLRDNHARLWLIRSRRGGLERSTAWYDRVIAELAP